MPESRQLTSLPESGDVGSVKSFAGLSSVGATCGDSENDPASEIGDVDEPYSDGNASETRSVFGSSSAGTAFITEPPSSSDGQVSVYDDGGVDTSEPMGSLPVCHDTFVNHFDHSTDTAIVDSFRVQSSHSTGYGDTQLSPQSSETDITTNVPQYSHADEGRIDANEFVESAPASVDTYANHFDHSNNSAAVDPFVEQRSHSSGFGEAAVSFQSSEVVAGASVPEYSHTEVSDGTTIDHQWGASDDVDASAQSTSSLFNDIAVNSSFAEASEHRTHFGGEDQSVDVPFKSNAATSSQPALTFGESATTSFFPSVEQTESSPEANASDYIPSAASLFGADSNSPEKESSPFSAFQQPSHYQSYPPSSLDTSPTDSAPPDTAALFGSTSTPGSPFESYNTTSANEYFGSSGNYGDVSSPYGSQFAPTHSTTTSHSQLMPPHIHLSQLPMCLVLSLDLDMGMVELHRITSVVYLCPILLEDAAPASHMFSATRKNSGEGSICYEGSVHSEQRSSLTPSLSRASLSSQVSQSSSRPAPAEQQDNYGRHQESHNDYMMDSGNVASTAQFFGHPSVTETAERSPQHFFSGTIQAPEEQAVFNSKDQYPTTEDGSTQVPIDQSGAVGDVHQRLSTGETAGLSSTTHNVHQIQSGQFGSAQASEFFDHHQQHIEASHQFETETAGDIDARASYTAFDEAPQPDEMDWTNPELSTPQPYASPTAGETCDDLTHGRHTQEPDPYVVSDGNIHNPEQAMTTQHQQEFGGEMFSNNNGMSSGFEDPFAGTSAPSNDFFSSSVAQSVGYDDPSRAIHSHTQADYYGYGHSPDTFASSSAYADNTSAEAFTQPMSSSQNAPDQHFGSSEPPSAPKTLNPAPQVPDHRQELFAQHSHGISHDRTSYFHPPSPSFQGASPSPGPVIPPQEANNLTSSSLPTPPAYGSQVPSQGYIHNSGMGHTMSTVHQTSYSSPTIQPAAFSTPTIKTSQKYKDPTQVAPSCLASFGFGGNVVTMFPKRKLRLNAASLGGGARHSPRMPGGQPFDSPQGELRKGPVSVYRMSQLHPRTKEYEEVDSFPGPLTSNVSEETILDYIEHKLQVLGSTARTAAEEDERLLVGVLKVLIKCNGRLRSELSGNPSDPDSPEVQLVTLLKESDQRRRRTHPYVFPTPKSVQYPNHPDATTRNATRIRELLLLGDRKAAVEVAIQAQMWPEAMLIASFTDKDEYKRVLCAYFSTHYAPGDPSRALFLCFADQQEKSVHEPQKLMTTAGHPGENGETSPVLSSWVVHVQMLLANRTADTNKILIELGDRLWKESGAVVAAHICYLLGGLTVEAPSHHSKMALLGGDHRTPEQSRFYVSPGTVQRTEIYEWVQKKRASTASSSGPGSNSQVPMVPFQGYKLIHAMMLVDFGKLETAFKYVNAMLTVLRSVTATMKPGTSMYLEGMQNQLTVLDDRLRQHLGQDRAESVAATVNAKQGKWGLGSALSIMGKIVNRVVEGGDAPPNQATGPPSSNGSLFPGAPRSNNASVPPDYPSASAMGLPYPTSQAAPLSNDRHTMGPPSYGSSAPSSHSHGGNMPTHPAFPHEGQVHHTSATNPVQPSPHAMTPQQLYSGHSVAATTEQSSGHIAAPPAPIPAPTPSSGSAKFIAYRAQGRNTAAPGSSNRGEGPVARPSSVPPAAAATQQPTPLYNTPPHGVHEQQQWHPPQEHHQMENSQPPAPPLPAPKFQKPSLDLSGMSASNPPPAPSGDEHVRRSSESIKPKSPRSPRDGPGSDKGSASPKFKDTKKSGRSKTPPPSRSSSGWLSGLSSFIATKINPEVKVAKLGEQMEAYFDEEKKRWVFPGETPSDEPTIPSAPPTGPLPGSTPASSSGGPPVGPPGTHSAPGSMAGSAPDDPLAALMAPPTSRAHAALMKKDPVSAMMAPPSRPMYGQRASTMPATRRPPRPQFAVFKPKAPTAEDQSAPSDGDAQ
ncbi:hypothetical protein PINS_up005128 [Pythium insidiosum]|nr:hypothetical protein PINS_up005128 [Pythium insidiosum]